MFKCETKFMLEDDGSDTDEPVEDRKIEQSRSNIHPSNCDKLGSEASERKRRKGRRRVRRKKRMPTNRVRVNGPEAYRESEMVY